MMRRTLITACLILTASFLLATTTTIHDVQYTTDPSGDSPLAGQVVTLQGVVTGVSPNGFFIADGNGQWDGVYVYTKAIGCALNVGDDVTVVGQVSEYHGMTEIGKTTGGQAVTCSVNSTGNPVAPIAAGTLDAAQEGYEGALIDFSAPSVTLLGTYGEWTVDDGTGDIIIDDEGGDYDFTPQLSDTLTSITGNVGYGYSAFRVQPRFSADVVPSEGLRHYALYGDVVTMNDNMDVLEDSYVEVLGDTIISVSSSAPAGAQIVAVNGLIFPGLIDAHNHPQYNVLGIIPFGQYFGDRAEWQATDMYNLEFKPQYNGIRDYGGSDNHYDDIWKLAEVRAMAAGTTMIQGSNSTSHSSDAYARLGIGIGNAGRFPSHAHSQTFPLTYSSWDSRFGEYWNRFVIHLCEGTDSTAANEFDTWQGAGHLDYRTTIIHGTAMDSAEFTALAAVNGSLVWSPKSNWILYGATADIPSAIATGLTIALAPDWTESGGRDILEEIRFAHQVDVDNWGGILSPEWFAKAVTRNAAFALGMEKRIGQIAPGYQADIAVFPGNPATPYETLLNSTPEDVELTVVAGRPGYGDPTIMDQFTFLTNVENVDLCGTTKRLALAVDNFAIPDSDKTFATILSELQAAYDATSPKLCEFLGLDPCASDLIFADGFETSGTSAWAFTAE